MNYIKEKYQWFVCEQCEYTFIFCLKSAGESNRYVYQ